MVDVDVDGRNALGLDSGRGAVGREKGELVTVLAAAPNGEEEFVVKAPLPNPNAGGVGC